MVRLVCALLVMTLPALFWPSQIWAQSRAVGPDDVSLTITLEQLEATPFTGEMLLLTIHGVYRRHITLEKLEQPALEGVNWMQLGQDDWFESQQNGRTVKNMRRRMAIFPQNAGRIEIGAFAHHLTLLDEDNKWFDHTVRSEPVRFDVAAAPKTQDWWLPVRRLEITDQWSNAPDQLAQGEGVLRVIRISALGASPDMIPPMPQLTSPSALIFAHPEKRLVELTPEGPVSVAFWRWTIQPRNGVSAILEPVAFSYFDTQLRQKIDVTISAQRIAYAPGAVALARPSGAMGTALAEPVALRSGLIAGAVIFSTLAGVALFTGRGQRLSGVAIARWLERLVVRIKLRRSRDMRDLAGLRRFARRLDLLAAPSADRQALLTELDAAIYGRATGNVDPGEVDPGEVDAGAFDPGDFTSRFCASLKNT